MPTAYILINSDLGTDVSIIEYLNKTLAEEKDIQFEVNGVYGVYDIIVKLTSENGETLRGIITNKVRTIDHVQSTLTMMVIDEQDKS
ncbi:MAG: Lrp/AsnC ligand binding domain-containing protein [Candidatus Nitrosopelagicus sp.]|nr:Lrp/AsnC ligand binding domain-containing protein [Candidatus Nitrosopelagicus sp.]